LSRDKFAENAFEKGVPVPDWVDQISVIPSGLDSNPLTMRLADVYFYVDQQTSIFTHRAIQANEASTLARIGQSEITFQPDYQRVQLHMLRVHRGSQILDKQNEADIRFLRREPELDSGIYGGSVTAAIVINDVRVGDTLEIAYTVIGKNPVFGHRFFDAAAWDNIYPTLKRRITLNAPEGRQIQYRVIGANQKNLPQAKESRVGNRRIVRFEASDMPVTDLESYMPSDYQALRWVQFSEFESWKDVTQWADGLFTVNAAPTALRDAVAAARAESNPRAKVMKALEFVQNEIRYLSVSIGENSHKPYPPEQVLARRYGDCKDKSLLLVAMLRQLGIEAAPVLVSTSHKKDLDQVLPSPQLFDHAIVHVVVQGKSYFLDPTRLGQVGELDRMGQPLAYSQALIIAPGMDKLVSIAPPSNEELITNTRIERVTVQKMSEPVLMSVQLQYAGADAEGMRNGLAQLSPVQLRKFYEGNIAKRYPDAVLLGEPKVSDERNENRVSVEIQFRIRDFFQVNGDRWSLQYEPNNLRGLFHVPNNANRNAPLAVPSFPSIGRYQLEVTLPDEFDARYSPSHATLQNPAFSLSESLSFSGKVIKVTLEMKLLADRLAANDTAAFLSDLNKAGRMLQGTLYIKQTDLRTASANIPSDVPFKQMVIERLEKIVKGTAQVIADAKLTGRDSSAASCERARVEAYLGRNAEAAADIQNAIRQQPNTPEILRCRAELGLVAGDFKASEQDFSRVLSLGLADDAIFLQRGIANFYLGKQDAAVSDFSKALSQAKGSNEKTRAVIWRTLASQRSGMAAVADTAAQTTDEWPGAALAMLSNKTTPEVMLRVVHKESGNALETALAEAYFYLGQHYLQAGDKLKARVYFQHSVDKGVLYSEYHFAARQELARLK
jgi:lipoprotein NlpI